MSRTPAEPTTPAQPAPAEARTPGPTTGQRPQAARAALWGALAALVAGLAATGTVIALAVRAG